MRKSNLKIALINPPSDVMGTNNSFKRINNLIPSLGFAYIAAVLEENGFKNLSIVESAIDDLSYEMIEEKMKQTKPDIIGVSCFTPSYYSSEEVGKRIKVILPDSICVLGGPHISSCPDDFGDSCFDVGVIGEGEYTFLKLVQQIEKEGMNNLEKIEGIVFRAGNKVQITQGREYIKNLDEIPHPARHLQPPFKKHRPLSASYVKLPQAYVITSRGCPTLCTFCDRAVFGEKIRFRSPENVVDEIEMLINNYGIRDIKFIDDTFTVKKSRVYALCDEIEKRKLKFPWECLTRTKAVDKNLLKRMKEVGCWQVLYGLESGDDRILKLLKKGTTVQDNVNAVKLAKEVGLNVRADFIVGTPGETYESLYKSLDMALELDVDYAHFNPFEPLPGTEIYRNLISEGVKINWKKTGIMDFESKKYIPSSLSPNLYNKFLIDAHKKFYLRPKYIFKRLLSIKSFDQFKGQWQGFLALLGL